MKAASFKSVGLMMVMVVICCRIPGVPAVVYTVGDSSGWAIGGDYGTWATDKTFAVGDTLVFNYAPGHTVDEVSAADFRSCTTGNAIASDSSGATSVTLRTAGPHYFICGVPGHCGGGMKLSVTVASGGAPSSTGAATSPPSATAAPGATASTAPPTGVATPTTGTLTQPSSAAAVSPAAAAIVAVFAAVVEGLVF